MRAAVLESPGSPLVVDDLELEPPQAGEVLVELHHCGLCHSDVHFIDGTLPGPLPLVLGHEAAGVVAEVGPGVTELAAGDRVVLTLRPACGRCYHCVRGERQLCAYGLSLMAGVYPDGSSRLQRDGKLVHRGLVLAAFAEATVVPVAAAVKVPDDTPLETAAVIGCAVQTGVGAVLNTARVTPGETVLVVGLGGIGISAVQGARVAGASRIVGVDTIADRRQQATGYGCTDTLDPTAPGHEEALRELTGGIGFDAAFECVGRAALVEQCWRAIRLGGRVVMVGVPAPGEQVAIPATQHAMQEKKLLGCFLGSSQAHFEMGRLLSLWRAGRLDLESMITARRPLGEINEAVADLQAGRGLRTVLDLRAAG